MKTLLILVAALTLLAGCCSDTGNRGGASVNTPGTPGLMNPIPAIT